MSRRTRPLELWLTRRALAGLTGLTGRLSHRSALAVGAAMGTAGYWLFPRYRRVALANLVQAYGGQWTAARIEATAREVFRNVGRTLVEFARLPATSPEEMGRLVRLEGREHFDAALALGRGALMIGAHFGNWEFLGAGLAHSGYRINVIARPFEDDAVEERLRAIRTRAGYHVIERRYSLRPAIECLRQNEILGLLIDQNAMTSTIWVDFFGRPAATNVGAAVIARRTGAALVPAFDHRLADGTHVIRVRPPIVMEPTADKERDVRDMMARLTSLIEEEVRGDPTQWLWLHNRWKYQPEYPHERVIRAAGTG